MDPGATPGPADDGGPRDGRGRLRPGHSGNPAGKPARSSLDRFLSGAVAAGHEVIIVRRPSPDAPARAA